MVSKSLLSSTALTILLVACAKPAEKTDINQVKEDSALFNGLRPISKPLIASIYTADPSAHVFESKVFIYPSHDIDSRIPETDKGDQYDMKDYHVLSMSQIDGAVTDHGVALRIEDIPWASRQLWAPDAALKDGVYYLYFPAKDKQGIFRMGVAKSDSPKGPFTAMPTPIEKSFSIDPCVFKDDDGSFYMYFGGIWGGQLQNWRTGTFNADDRGPNKGEVAIGPRVAKLAEDMTSFDGDVKEVLILDEFGSPLTAGDNERRFFEAAWIHKYNGKYYLSYSTGDTHNICYATSENLYGPFRYQGVILKPVLGWTTHHSIIEFNGKWYLFYHDATLSKGVGHLRNVKVTPMLHLPDGTIKMIEPYVH